MGVLKNINDGPIPQYDTYPSLILVHNSADHDRILPQPILGSVDVNVS